VFGIVAPPLLDGAPLAIQPDPKLWQDVVKKLLAPSVVLLVLFVRLIDTSPRHASAAAPVWQTTFNCSDWNQQLGLGVGTVNCDGMSGEGDWGNTFGPNGHGSEITAAANYAAGGGGKGFRMYRDDGFDVNSGGMWVNLPAASTEVWVRFYMRYQSGFQWLNGGPSFTKDVYMLGNTAPNFTMGFHSTNSWGLVIVSPQSDHLASPGWSGINGGPVGDGKFHCYEWHSKVGSTTSNGVAEVWVDNRQTLSDSNVNFSGTGNWRQFALGENSSSPNNGRAMAVDYDDVAVSVTGRVGCIGAPPAPRAPATPQNLRIIKQ
jgi:hypothetical protein